MDDICKCCNGCSSVRQLSTYPKYSFPKKLLVAISLVVLIVMILPPTEARALQRRHVRHRHLVTMSQTKDIQPVFRHGKKHQKRLENLTLATKESKRPKNAEIYVKETKKIVKKVKNTRSYFKEDQKQLMWDLKKWYRALVPSWLPTVNFVEIHFHNYSNERSRKNGSSVPERKFKYLMPRLYKSLVEYEELFKRLQKMELDFPDTPQNSYKNKRKKLLQNTLNKLYSTIQEVNDSMAAVNMTVPTFRSKDLSKLGMRVNESDCLRNDYLAFRGYGNLLNNWYFEFRCPRNKLRDRQNVKKICRYWEDKLKEKLNSRSGRIGRIGRIGRRST